jgi:hypothetical protein
MPENPRVIAGAPLPPVVRQRGHAAGAEGHLAARGIRLLWAEHYHEKLTELPQDLLLSDPTPDLMFDDCGVEALGRLELGQVAVEVSQRQPPRSVPVRAASLPAHLERVRRR